MSSQKFDVKRILRFIPMVVMMIIIFMFSAMEGDESSNTSGLLLRALEKITESLTHGQLSTETLGAMHLVIRKCAHFTEYAMLGASILFALKEWIKKRWACILVPTLISCIYATTDEIHQYFVPGRYGTWTDVCIDTCGALAGILIFYALFCRRHHEV